MNITDHLDRAARDHDTETLDLRHLARVARTQGARSRRRRHGVTLLGTAAVVGLVVTGTTAIVTAGPDARTDLPVAQGSRSSAPAVVPVRRVDTSRTGPFTGRGVVAALRDSIARVREGSAGGYAGQQGAEAYGQLDWTDADGEGVSVVGINVQPRMHFVSSCGTSELRCTRRAYRGGTLTTYEEHTPVTGGVGIRRVADFLRADHTRVVVGATNGYELPRSQWNLTRAQPPLDYAQLTRIVSHRWWGVQLPARFLAQGEQLSPYDDLGEPWPDSVTAAPSPGSVGGVPSGMPSGVPSGMPTPRD